MAKGADRFFRSAFFLFVILVLYTERTLTIALAQSPPPLEEQQTAIPIDQAPSNTDQNSYLSVNLDLPNSSWHSLTESQLRSLSNIAVVGALNGQNAFGLVLVEPVKSMKLNDYASALLENTSLQELLIESVTEVKYQNYSALRLVYSGDEANGRFRYLSYVLIDNQKGYQIVSGGPVGLVNADSLETFSRSVTLQRLAQKSQPKTVEAYEDYGEGWQLTDGQFSHIISGLNLVTKPTWTILTGQSLNRVNRQAFAGLVHRKDQVHILFFDRPCPTKNNTKCKAWSQDELYADLELIPLDESYEYIVLGEPRIFKRLRHKGGTYTYLHHVIVRKGRALQILAWTLSPAKTAAGEEDLGLTWQHLHSGLAQAKWLETTEKSKTLAMGKIKAQTNTFVRSHESWMWGTYHHFKSGLQWTRPPGIWQVISESQSSLKSPNSLFTIHAPRYGLTSQLRISVGHHLVADQLHQSLWSELIKQLQSTRGHCTQAKTSSYSLVGQKVSRTICTLIKTKNILTEWTYQLDTFEGSGSVIHMLTWAPKDLFFGEGTLVRVHLENGLKLSAPAAVILSSDHRIIDERFRYQLNNLPSGTLRVRSSLDVGTASSSVELNTTTASLVSFAVSKVQSKTLVQLVNRLTQSQQSHGSLTKSVPIHRQKVWVKGHPAERLTWMDPKQSINRGALLITVPPLIYGLVAVGSATAVKQLLSTKNFETLSTIPSE